MLGSRYTPQSVCGCGSAYYILHEELELILNQLCLLDVALIAVFYMEYLSQRKSESWRLYGCSFHREAGASLERELVPFASGGFSDMGWRSPC